MFIKLKNKPYDMSKWYIIRIKDSIYEYELDVLLSWFFPPHVVYGKFRSLKAIMRDWSGLDKDKYKILGCYTGKEYEGGADYPEKLLRRIKKHIQPKFEEQGKMLMLDKVRKKIVMGTPITYVKYEHLTVSEKEREKQPKPRFVPEYSHA